MGEGGKIPLGSGLGRPLYSRPLRTGKTFTLVVSSAQVNYVHWDRDDYAPGDSCVLTIVGKNLGTQAVEVVIEEAQKGGAWTPVDKAQLQIGRDGSTATAKWKVPIPAGHAEAVAAREEARRGKLIEAGWAKHEVEEGGALAAQIRVEGMEGEKLTVVVEREMPDGSWRTVAADQGEVRDGNCAVPWTPPVEQRPPPEPGTPPPGELVGCRFEDGLDLRGAETAWLKVNCAGMESERVQFVLEREDAGGWAEVSSAVSTVNVGEARAPIGVPGSPSRPSR